MSSNSNPAPARADGTPFPERLQEDQLRRLAEMVADGRAELPAEASPADALRLHQAIRQCLSARLLRLVARALAHHLQPRPPDEDTSHA